MGDETDVVVIGSGFGGAVAALRFAEAGRRVVVLERGAPVSRDGFEADLDALWAPDREAYGVHDVQRRGRPVVPWVGAAVGGGSHAYAATLLRRHDFTGFPAAIRADDLAPYYARAEAMMDVQTYPADREPYASVPATRLMLAAGARLARERPELVEHAGPLPLGVSFAPAGAAPGAPFTNRHGAPQRYWDPREQALLGGDIGAKNTLDRNYLWRAARAAVPAEIRALCEAERLARTDDGRWRVEYARRVPLTGWARFRRRWLPWAPPPRVERGAITARTVVVAAGAIGSSELLLRQRDVHRTIALGPALGRRYSTNGDYLTLILPWRGLVGPWLAFAALVACAILRVWPGALAALAAYYAALAFGPRSADPDLGPTNSDHVRFRGRDGRPQGAYIESGRYPTPGRLVAAIAVSAVSGRLRPRAYRAIVAASRALRWLVPPFGAIARTYPIPLLTMGRDDAHGTFRLDGGRAVIDYDLAANRGYLAWLDELGRLVARAAGALWLPDLPWKLLGRFEVPHNLGGVPMADDESAGVVDHAGRVFGHDDLMVLDGSIIPVAIGPNPALTILAIAERAMDVALAQLAADGHIRADATPAAAAAPEVQP